MSDGLRDPIPMTAWGKAALILVVVAGIVLAWSDGTLAPGDFDTWALLLASATYIALATVDGIRERMGVVTFLCVHHALALALPWLGEARTAVAPVAAISLTGLAFRPRWVAIPATLHVLNVAWACHTFLEKEAGRLFTLNFVVAAVFVMAFTEVVSNQVRIRIRLDAATRKLEAQAALTEEVATLGERARIARELHDSLGHALTAAHVQLQVAARDIAMPSAQGQGAVRSAQRAIREGLDELRATVRALHAPAARISALEPALRRLLDDHSARLESSLRVEGAPARLPPHLSLALYRATQESLTNAAKHAGASRVDVTLRYRGREVELSIRDDGCGLPPERREGFGLRGLRERIEGLGGTVTLVNDVGLRVTATIPLDAER